MIDFTKYPILDKRATLRDISVDSANGEYMTELTLNAVDFDKVKEIYINNMHGKERKGYKSIDAILCENDKILFIEFKNGILDEDDIEKIRIKIRDSIIIYSDITSTTVSYFREKVEFVLVYNKLKNSCDGLQRIKKYIEKKSRLKLIQGGFNRFKGIYFNDVHTFAVDEFERYINR